MILGEQGSSGSCRAPRDPARHGLEGVRQEDTGDALPAHPLERKTRPIRAAAGRELAVG